MRMENAQSIIPYSVHITLNPLTPDTLDPFEALTQEGIKEAMQYKGNFCAIFSTLWNVSF